MSTGFAEELKLLDMHMNQLIEKAVADLKGNV